MKEELFLYCFSNKLFYESLAYAKWNKSDEWMNIVGKCISYPKYLITEEGFYLKFSSRTKKIPTQGWKIHISASINNITDILAVSSNYLADREISFKIIKSKELYLLTSQKGYPREMYGKFITVYPSDENEFKEIVKDLYQLLREFDGPRILSDRRYKSDCKVLYYRYGGMKPYCMHDTMGNVHYYIKNDKGDLVEDIRTPYYEKLSFVNDPFKMESLPNSELLKHYDILDVLQYKNSGGIYIAKNNEKKYIIKEARPHTMLGYGNIDAIAIRKKEAELLKQLIHEECVPNLIDAFMDSEHFFLIEEYFGGDTLYEYTMFNNSYLRNDSVEKVEKYLFNYIHIFSELASFLSRMEKENIVISDISADNIIITEDNKIKFVDLEGAAIKGEHIYMCKDSNREVKSTFCDFSMLMFFCLFGKADIISISQDYINVFWTSITKEYSGLIDSLYIIFMKIYNEEFSSFEVVKSELEKLHQRKEHLIKNSVPLADIKKIEEYSQNLYLGIISSKNIINERVYPCSPFINNEFNISNGRVGVEFALSSIKKKSFEIDNYDLQLLGLFTGVSGILWTYIENDMFDDAEKLAKRMIPEIDVNCNDISYFSGLSGIATILLKQYYINSNEEILSCILEIERNIRKKISNNTIKKYGLKNGLTGISILYLSLYLVTNETKYYQFGYDILLKEFEHLVFRDDGKIDLMYEEDGVKASPYFLEGTAGLLSVLIRYYYISKDTKLEFIIKSLSAGIEYNQVLSCTLFYGNAGIGNVFLDCYYFINDEIYLEKAIRIAEKCSLYEYKMSEGGALVPDVFNKKLSADLGYGAAGVMLFLNRLCRNERNNFCFPFDELINERNLEYV